MKNRVISNSLVYTICGLLQKCFTIILLPLYTAYLTTDEYGITNIANTFILTMSFVVAFSLFSAVLRFYVDLKNKDEKLKRFYGTVMIFTFISWVFYFSVLTLFRRLLCKYVFAGTDFYPIVFLCLISLLFNCQHEIYDNALKSQQKAVKASVLGLCYFAIQVVLNIIFVVILKMGAVGIVLSTLIAGASYTIFFWVDMIKHKAVILCIDIQLLKDALKYSIPVMPHNLSTRISMLVSSALIGGTSTLSALGIYSVAAQFGNVSDTILTYVNNAYAPWLFESIHDASTDYKNNIRESVNTICLIIGLFFICIALFSQDYILLLLRKEYAHAWRYVPLIVSVYSIKIVYYFYVSVLFYYKKATRVLFISTLSSSLLNVLLSSILIPQYGVYGSITADAFATFVCVSIVVFISLRFDDVGLKLIDFGKLILLINSFIYIGHYLSYTKNGDSFSLLNLGYKLFVVLIYVTICAIRNQNEIKRIATKVRLKK